MSEKHDLASLIRFWLNEYGEEKAFRSGTVKPVIRKETRLSCLKALFEQLVAYDPDLYNFFTLKSNPFKRQIIEAMIPPEKAVPRDVFEKYKGPATEAYEIALHRFFEDLSPKNDPTIDKQVEPPQAPVETVITPDLRLAAPKDVIDEDFMNEFAKITAGFEDDNE